MSARALNNLVLLTATIRPPQDARNLARRDAGLRLADYCEAFEFYVAELEAGSIDAVVFCDNSGFDLTPLRRIATSSRDNERIELLSFDGLDHPAHFGRGFGEFKLVDHAMANSRLAAALSTHGVVWKVTGRYRIRNLRQLIRSRPPQADLYCNCRNIPIRWLDMYVMGWNRTAYDEIIRGIYRDLKQDESPTSAEQLFRRLIDARRFRSTIVRRFRHTPVIDGIRGGDNADHAGMKRKHYLRVVARRLVPWLWL